MYTIAFSLIACGCTFNCCAIAFLILDKRKRDLQKKILQKNLEDIDYHLHKARTVRMANRSSSAWLRLVFIIYATLSSIDARPVIAGGFFTVLERFGAYAVFGFFFIWHTRAI